MRRKFVICGDDRISTFLVKRTIIGIARRYGQSFEDLGTRDLMFLTIGESDEYKNALLVFYGENAIDMFFEVKNGGNFMQSWAETNQVVCVLVTDGKAPDTKEKLNGVTYITCSRKHLETRLTSPVGYKCKRKIRY